MFTDLTDQQVEAAIPEQVIPNTIFPRVDRRYNDDPIPNQIYCVHSFVPALGATPNKHGVFGFVKCRGCYATESDAKARCAHIIKHMDSYNKLYTSFVGSPFRMCVDGSKFSSEKEEIDIKKTAIESINKMVKEQRTNEQDEVKTIKEREENLVQVINDETGDPREVFTMKITHRANLLFALENAIGRLKNEILPCLWTVNNQIREIEADHPDYYPDAVERYNSAREQVGIKDDEGNSFYKYLVVKDAGEVVRSLFKDLTNV
jgi:hypothetical protein